MAENHPGREERETQCPACGAAIHYSIEPGGTTGAGGSLRCPSCGRDVPTDGQNPQLLEFGPGKGQHGA